MFQKIISSINLMVVVFCGSYSFQVHGMQKALEGPKVLDNSVQFTEVKPVFTLVSKLLGIRKGEEPREAPIQSILQYKAQLKQHNEETLIKKILPGQDGRKQVSSTTRYPYSCFCHLNSTLDGDSYLGSGVLVGSQHILTCAHNVFNLDKRKWVDQCTAYFGLNGANAPFGSCSVVRFYVPDEYTRDGNPEFDIALIVIDRPMGLKIGYLGCLFSTDIKMFEEDLNITGYPGDKGGTTMWTMANKAKKIHGEKLYYDIDTYGGQSGSPVWSRFGLDDESQIDKQLWPLVVGIHTQGESIEGEGNSGTRLTEDKFKRIMNWMAQTGQLVVQLTKSPQAAGGLEVPARKPMLVPRRPLPAAPVAAQQPAPLPTSPTEYDPKINEVDADGKSALHRASENGNIQVVQALILRWADVKMSDKRGYTPLHSAAENGEKEIVELLLDNRAAINARTSLDKNGWKTVEGRMPLHFAIEKGHLEIAKVLIGRGADVNAMVEDYYGEYQGASYGNPLLMALRANNNELAMLLISNGAIVRYQGISSLAREKHTYLHQAARHGNTEMILFLLSKDADLESRDSNDETPLFTAIYSNQKETVKLLLEKGASARVVSRRLCTPLRECVKLNASNCSEIIKMLLDYGADPSIKDSDKKTAFDLAKDPAIKALLKQSAPKKKGFFSK